MSRKVFTAGEVLAAADVNSFLMDQSVMSFAGTAARGSAIPSPVEGMVTYLEDIDDLRAYNGSAWVSPQGLTLIKKQDIGSAVSSVVVSDAFSADYDSYKVILNGGVASTENFLSLKLGAANTQYYQTRISYLYTGTINVGTDNNAAQWTIGGTGDTASLFINLELVNPFLTKQTFVMGGQPHTQASGFHSGVQKSNTSFTDFTITPNSGNITGGTIYVYGYRRN